MNLLWMSNAPWAGTGYGQQTKLVLKGLLDRGINPACFAFYGLSGGAISYDGYICLPNSNQDGWGNDIVKAHAERGKNDAIVSLIDVFVLDTRIWREMGIPWFAWTPIDSETIGVPTLQRLKVCPFPVAMSHHGAEQMMNHNISPVDVIYHAVDTEMYQPLDQRECRDALGIDQDAYLVGMVMANKGDRKQYPLQLETVKRWMDQNPDRNIKIYIHTDTTSSLGGWDLQAVVNKLGLHGKVYSTSQYDARFMPLGGNMMAKIYNSFDVLLNCSMGEGFGIPIIEAQACGVPVLATNATTPTELVKNGYLVEPLMKQMVHHMGYQFIPDPEDLLYRLESIYRRDKHGHSEMGRSWVKQNCGVDIIVDKWYRLLTETCATIEQERAKLIPAPHPKGTENEAIALARQAMEEEAEAYGAYEMRIPEYDIVLSELQSMGLKEGDRILDLGGSFGDLGRFFHDRGWHGVYVPVDMTIDGTDLEHYTVPDGYNYIVLEQVIEHLNSWESMLDQIESKRAGLVIATPNKSVVGEGDKMDYAHQMAHVLLFDPEDFEKRGYKVSTYSLTGQPDDTIVATKLGGVDEDSRIDHREVPLPEEQKV